MKYKNIIVEALSAVEKLNQECYDVFEEKDGLTFPIFELSTDGFSVVVSFMGKFGLWFSNEDERKFFEEANEYESLEEYLRKEAQTVLKMINQISKLVL